MKFKRQQFVYWLGQNQSPMTCASGLVGHNTMPISRVFSTALRSEVIVLGFWVADKQLHFDEWDPCQSSRVVRLLTSGPEACDRDQTSC